MIFIKPLAKIFLSKKKYNRKFLPPSPPPPKKKKKKKKVPSQEFQTQKKGLGTSLSLIYLSTSPPPWVESHNPQVHHTIPFMYHLISLVGTLTPYVSYALVTRPYIKAKSVVHDCKLRGLLHFVPQLPWCICLFAKQNIPVPWP